MTLGPAGQLVADKPCRAINVGPGVSPPVLGSRMVVGLPLLTDRGDVDTASWAHCGDETRGGFTAPSTVRAHTWQLLVDLLPLQESWPLARPIPLSRGPQTF